LVRPGHVDRRRREASSAGPSRRDGAATGASYRRSNAKVFGYGSTCAGSPNRRG
jgi:hypothetical protein